MNLNELRDTCHTQATNSGFWNNPTTLLEHTNGQHHHTIHQLILGQKIALIHSELSEALEAGRDGHDPAETWYGDNGKPEGIPPELADTIIRILDYCGWAGIDIHDAILEKLAYNRRKRSHLHGREF